MGQKTLISPLTARYRVEKEKSYRFFHFFPFSPFLFFKFAYNTQCCPGGGTGRHTGLKIL